jgi:hypothetical protein
MHRTARYYLAAAVMVIMFILHWNFWMSGAVYPIILGMPILVVYHVVYLLASVLALWFFFDTIWPDEPEEY